MGKGFNNHFRKEKCTYSFLLTKVLELDGVSVFIQANRWNLPRVLAQLNANTFLLGCGVEDRYGTLKMMMKRPNKILNFLCFIWKHVLFTQFSASFHSPLLLNFS